VNSSRELQRFLLWIKRRVDGSGIGLTQRNSRQPVCIAAHYFASIRDDCLDNLARDVRRRLPPGGFMPDVFIIGVSGAVG
jgi:hypothetical protein